MKTKHILSSNVAGQHKIAYQDWGDESNPNVLICVHGLTRNSRDFDYLAKKLCDKYRVIAPDIVGRGKSDWLPEAHHYSVEQYIKDMQILLQDLKVQQVDWLGTSLGGIIGMGMAASPNSPVRRLILNDIGPLVRKEVTRMLAQNLAATPEFRSLEELEHFLRIAYRDTGELHDQQWQHMAQHDHQIQADGTIRRAYDPKIFHAIGQFQDGDIDMWPYWDKIQCPALVLHGAESKVLTQDICEEMLARKANTEVVTIPNVGHTPSLMIPGYIDVVAEWLS
jgi:pimeloyl-ACP methyl ester carboxylesterase